MSARLRVLGGQKLTGEINMYSAKNAVLPLLAASVLTDEKCEFINCPDIEDIHNMLLILEDLGCECSYDKGIITVTSGNMSNHEVSTSLSSKLRSSIFLMGSILGRFKKAIISYPGGCNIGLRPINLHIEGLKRLNVKIKEENGFIYCDGSEMKGGEVVLDFPSVGATENIMMAACLSKGKTIIKNAAREPEIIDLQDFINACGGKVIGAGKNTIEILGVKSLHGCLYKPIPDRIVTGTYLISAAMSGGEITINNANIEHIYSLIVKLRESACKIYSNNDKIHIIAPKKLVAIKNIQTSPYPGFPTDLQAQVMSMETISKGVSIIEEKVFETRFRQVSELIKMRADITISGRVAIVKGVSKLCGAEVKCFDLRGGAAMVMAGLVADGETIISSTEHIDRGYQSIENELSAIGAKITREEEL